MANHNDQRLTLLDPTHAYQHFEATLDRRIFIRFHEHNLCVSHVNARSEACRSDIYFFLPDDSTNLIDASGPSYNNILYHIYCRDLHSEQLNKDAFFEQARGRVFTLNNLSFRLRQAAAQILLELSQKAPYQSNMQQEYRAATARQLRNLAAELEQHRDTQSSQQPVETG